ncbi:uncharacterized protein LOC120625433 [Pararge aegeria]|uniref:uncharacterized protein LOC120625433 n=1 Tax=Pararge aegeria TaxID=116150 RepID=UPI0019D18FF2|nr:uncharacterized protein LOC120625433 [Pararge aegeria]
MGVFSIVDLLYFLCRITIIQFASVPVTSCNPTASRLYPAFSSTLFPSNEHPELLSSTIIDNNFSYKKYNSPELFSKSKGELLKSENPNPFTNSDASLLVPYNIQRTFTPLSTEETSSFQYDTTETIIKNSNLMQELLNRISSSVVSSKDVVTQSNLQATQKPLTVQSSKHQAQYPTSVPSLILNKLPEYSFNYTSPMLSHNLPNQYDDNSSNKVSMPQTENVVSNNFSEDNLISNSSLLKTPTLLPNIGPPISAIHKANIPVSKDTNSFRTVSKVCMPASNYIGLALPKENNESSNLSFNNPPVLPNIELTTLITKDCLPIIKDSNSFKLLPAEHEFKKLLPTISSTEICFMPNLNKNLLGSNGDIDIPTKIIPLLHNDTEIYESSPPKFLPNWQITQKVFQCDNSKRQNEPSSVPLVNVKNSFVTNTPNLPVLDIRTQEIGAIIPKKDVLYPSRNRKGHCRKKVTDNAITTPVTETENNQL